VWEFLTKVLDKGGVVAALFFLLVIGFGIAVRVLWKQNQELQRKLHTQSEAHAELIRSVAETHAVERKVQTDECSTQLMTLSSRIDQLQEQRVDETRDVTIKMMTYISNVDRFVSKLETAIDVLIQAGRKSS